jgi:hypothetical protein
LHPVVTVLVDVGMTQLAVQPGHSPVSTTVAVGVVGQQSVLHGTLVVVMWMMAGQAMGLVGGTHNASGQMVGLTVLVVVAVKHL